MVDKHISYCGIGEVQYKMFSNRKLMRSVCIGNKICPIHAVIIPTNRCNLKCEFCNCKDRIVNEELSQEEMNSIVETIEKCKIETLTFSGGGEPTLFPYLKETIQRCNNLGMSIGLVTNGTNNNLLAQYEAGSFSWIRISCGDGRDLKQIESIVDSSVELVKNRITKKVGFSYIITKKYDRALLTNIVERINKIDEIMYIKILADCLADQIVLDNDILSKSEKIILADPSPVHYSGDVCYFPLVKPVFAADGFIYPCCDIQYHEESRQYSKSMRVCHYSEYVSFVRNQDGKYLNGHICTKCYHSTGNIYLQCLKNGIDDSDWI